MGLAKYDMSVPGVRLASCKNPSKGLVIYVTLAFAACCLSNLFNRFSESGQAVVFTLVDTATTELQQRAEASEARGLAEQELNNTQPVNVVVRAPADENKTEDNIHGQYVVHAEPKKIGREVTTEEFNLTDTQTATVTLQLTDQILNATDDKDHKVDHEEIPSFSEWTQKQLEEAEKKEKVNTSVHNHHIKKLSSNLKLRSKNYASPDCGAKIVAANPESKSASSVLSPSRDEYKLNACTNKIWFVVELCEAIQAKKIDLANFELFSSSPKEFTVSVSDRFPSREWSSVGHFTAKDEKDIQSFNLHPHLFGKFIKVEVLSHYGSEHFCPISLFRVYGTSEFEVLETEDQANQNIIDDEDDDETLDVDENEPSNNLFGSARDAVMSIVKKAAEVLVNSGDGINRTGLVHHKNVLDSKLHDGYRCTSPSHIVVCDNCSDVFYGEVYDLLSCQRDFLRYLTCVPIVHKTFYNTNLCSKYGLNICKENNFSTYILNIFSPKYVAAICNILAVQDNKVVLNISNLYSNTSSLNNSLSSDFVQIETKSDILQSSCPMDSQVTVETCASKSNTYLNTDAPTVINVDSSVDSIEAQQIRPTRTLRADKIDSSYLSQESSVEHNVKLDPSESVHLPVKTVENPSVDSISDNALDVKTDEMNSTSYIQVPEMNGADSTENFEIVPEQLDNLLSEFNLESDSAATTATPANSVPQQQQKESVFLRLSNRIKALERNMSLSGQYLEELSRRYKKQVEEMQRVFEKKLSALFEENKKSNERADQMQKQLLQLTSSLENLLSEKDSMWKTVSLLGQFLLMEIFVTYFLLYFCWRSPKPVLTKPKKQKPVIPVKRRKSIDVIHESPAIQKKRRPSEEMLCLSGNYEDLLIVDPDEVDGFELTRAEKRRRRKKNSVLRSGSSVSYKEPLRRASSSDVPHKMFQRQESAPPRTSVYANGDLTPTNRIDIVPFPLDESEHVFPMDYTEIRISRPNSADNSLNGSVKSSVKSKISSPLFMMTALSSRSKRNSTSKSIQMFKTDKADKNSSGILDSSQRNSPEPFRMNIGDCQDDQSSINSDTVKKEKKSGGFKRIFKKVFE